MWLHTSDKEASQTALYALGFVIGAITSMDIILHYRVEESKLIYEDFLFLNNL